MKTQESNLPFGKMVAAIFLFGFLISNDAFSCEACNRIFLAQLGTTRSGDIVSRELLATIAAQRATTVNDPAWVGEVLAYNNMLTDASPAPLPKGSPKGAAVPNTSPQQNGTQARTSTATNSEFIEIIRRDERLPIPPTSYVPQNTRPDKKVRITLEEGDSYIGNGIIYKGFSTDGKIPGPTVLVEEGDIVQFTIVNKGNIPHGASIHAANTQTSKYLGKINPDDSATIVFKAAMPGVYMYHCAPGGHAIPMHIIFGQYGMMVVKPKKKYELERILNKEPDIELYLVQHEFYASGKDAVEGQGKPMYTAFNGKLFRYIEEPIKGRPGDYVRINFLNVGPNLLSTFHIVGIVWDFA